MSRKSKFTWNASNTEEFEKTIKNYNAKIYRQRKAHPELKPLLPDPILKADKKELAKILESDYVSQADFDRQMRSLKRFSHKDSTKVVEDAHGNEMLKYKQKEIEYKVNYLNQKRKKEREEVLNNPFLIKKGNLEYEELEPIKLKEIEKPNWKQFEKMLDKKLMSGDYERRINQYKEKFLAKLESLPADTDNAYDFFKRIPAKELWEARYQKDSGLTARVFYDPSDDAQPLVENVMDRWREYLGLPQGTYEDMDSEEMIEELQKIIDKRS